MSRISRTVLRATVPAAVLAFGLAFAGPASADTVAVNAYDTDANGYADAYGFDSSGDGYEDTWAIDWNEDGIVEQLAADTDYDGRADAWAFDTEEDGYVEQVAVDTNYDAVPDVWGIDEDFDGYVDWLYYDTDGDGYTDTYEAAYSTAYAYASVTYAFIEAADGSVYWEASYEYGYGYSALDNSDSGIQAVTDTPDRAGTATPDSTDVVQDALHSLFPTYF